MNIALSKNSRQVFYTITVLMYIIMYIYVATDKVLSFDYFQKALDAQVFDDKYTPILSYLLPSIESICVLLLIIPKLQRIGLIVSTLLMLAFTIYVVIVLLFYMPGAPCACGGLFKSLSWEQHLVVNLVFLIAGAYSIKIYSHEIW